MQKLKKVILVLGPIVLAVGLYFTFAGEGSPVPGTVYLVNVTTGKLETIAQSKLGIIPAPDSSGRSVLYPVDKDPATGAMSLGERYRSDLLARMKSKELKAEDVKIDLKTFAVSKN